MSGSEIPAGPALFDAADGPTARWRLFSDQVMGGVSTGAMREAVVDGRRAVRFQGQVSLENNGGFLQIAMDLDPGGRAVDLSAFTGLVVEVFGNGETYNLHLRTPDTARPWQSYRQAFEAPPCWRSVRLPFEGFAPHRLDRPLDRARIVRLGLVAIGRAFEADLAVARVAVLA